MRVVIYGLGAVGGSVAAALARKGKDVVGIARGSHLQVIRDRGLRFRAPGVDEQVTLTAVAAPSEITFRPEDLVLLAMKTQDTLPALAALRAAGVTDQPIFCLQNGVANERMALRMFPNVHGVTVMMPSTYLVAGEVAAFGTPCFGVFDIGRYPSGRDADDTALAEILTEVGFGAFEVPDVMASKYGKLLMNLGNILRAALGKGPDTSGLHAQLKAEATAIYDAAGIAWQDVGSSDPRRQELLNIVDVPGVQRGLGSTTQSLQRGMPLETDYLNGEIALLGRLHGIPAPLNDGLCRIAADLAASGAKPGDMAINDLLSRLGLPN